MSLTAVNGLQRDTHVRRSCEQSLDFRSTLRSTALLMGITLQSGCRVLSQLNHHAHSTNSSPHKSASSKIIQALRLRKVPLLHPSLNCRSPGEWCAALIAQRIQQLLLLFEGEPQQIGHAKCVCVWSQRWPPSWRAQD